MNKIFRNAMSLAVAGIFVSPLQAQVLEEIIVSAQKREQNLQEVPISIVAITGDDIQAGGFSDMEDLSTFVPNLFMSDALTGQNISVRGIGTSVANEAFEQAVAQFHDGVYYGRDNMGQSSFFDLERVEVVRGPAPVFAGQSATAGALSYISRRPGDQWEGSVSASYGSDEELSVDGAYGGPVSDTFSVRVSGRYYELEDTDYTHVITGDDVGTKQNWGARIIGVWAPNDDFELTFKYEHQDVSQIGVANEYSRCETRPALSFAHDVVAPLIGGLCALDAAYNGINLNKLDGVVGSGGAIDVRAAMDELNAASGAMLGDPNYWGNPFSPVARNLNNVDAFTQEEKREHDSDVVLLAFDWDINDTGLTLSSATSYVEYDKHDITDPDMSSFAVFAGERAESFEQFSQEIRLSSAEDQRFTWMVGAYYQEHEIETQIDVHLAWLFDLPNFFSRGMVPPAPDLDPTVFSAVGFGGPLKEDSRWLSAFFNSTFNVTDSFRVNVGGRYVEIEKDGTLTPERARLRIGATAFDDDEPFGAPVSGEADTKDFLPEVGIQWDMSEGVMFYAKYSEALKAGGFVMSPPIGGALPDPFTYDPEYAEGWEFGVKALLLDGALVLNTAIYNTDFTDLQVSVFVPATGQFITDNAAEAHTKGIEIDGRWAINDSFSLGFSGSYGEAEYDEYNGATCNSVDAKQAVINAGGNPMAPCFIDGAGRRLPFAPDWSFNIQPEYRASWGEFQLTASANFVTSDGYEMDSISADPLFTAPKWHRLDLRLAIAPGNGQWEVALYGRDVTDEQRTISNAFQFLSKSRDLVFDGGGPGRDRGARYGVQLSYLFN